MKKDLINNNTIIFALPKGRILKEFLPILKTAGIIVEEEFFVENSRRLFFTTNLEELKIIKVRSFDSATFVAFGGAHLGVSGVDVLNEFNYPELYAPLDLKIGKCRLIVAESKELAAGDNPKKWSHIRVATKYPETTRRHFEARGVQAECIKLNGAMELAPKLGMCRRIVDLVDTGRTLEANGLVEVEHISNVSSHLIINRAANKTRPKKIKKLLKMIKEAVNA